MNRRTFLQVGLVAIAAIAVWRGVRLQAASWELGVSELGVTTVVAADARGEESPLATPTLELTPPWRPTPTGGPPHPGHLGDGARRIWLPVVRR
jgi:hypothetical protein